MSYLYLIRHGQTPSDEEPERLDGWAMTPLDEKGLAVAHELADTLKNKPISKLYHSGLRRGQSTANIVAPKIGAQIVQDQGLKPWDVGEHELHMASSAQKKLNHYRKHPDEVVPGGESYNQFYDRFKEALLKLTHEANNSDSDIAAITHSNNFTVVHNILSDGEAPIDHHNYPDNGSIVPIRVSQGKWSIGRTDDLEN